MSAWNHRITRERTEDGDFWFTVREVYYDDEGRVDGWTADPIAASGESAKEVADVLGQMAGCLALGVLDLDTRETLRPGGAR